MVGSVAVILHVVGSRWWAVSRGEQKIILAMKGGQTVGEQDQETN